MLPGRLCNTFRETIQCCRGDCAIPSERLYNAAGRLCNTARETVQYCWGDCVLLPGRLCSVAQETVQCCPGELQTPRQDCAISSAVLQVSPAAFHSLQNSIAQSPQQHCSLPFRIVVSLATLHTLPGSIAQSPGKHCTVSPIALDSLPGTIARSANQNCTYRCHRYLLDLFSSCCTNFKRDSNY